MRLFNHFKDLLKEKKRKKDEERLSKLNEMLQTELPSERWMRLAQQTELEHSSTAQIFNPPLAWLNIGRWEIKKSRITDNIDRTLWGIVLGAFGWLWLDRDLLGWSLSELVPPVFWRALFVPVMVGRFPIWAAVFIWVSLFLFAFALYRARGIFRGEMEVNIGWEALFFKIVGCALFLLLVELI